MGDRVHTLKAKPGQLRAGWGRPGARQEPDLVYAWGGGGAEKSDSRIVMRALEELETYSGLGLRAELERRGYDIKTLKFSISLKEGEGDG